jgi:hypothetical protein
MHEFNDELAAAELIRGLTIDVFAVLGGIAICAVAAKKGLPARLAIEAGFIGAVASAVVAERFTRPTGLQ